MTAQVIVAGSHRDRTGANSSSNWSGKTARHSANEEEDKKIKVAIVATIGGAWVRHALAPHRTHTLSTRTRPRGKHHTFTYTGLLRCATCNGLLTGERKKGRYVYYGCRGRKGRRHYYPETFEAETLRILNTLAIDDALSEWFITELGYWFDDTASNQTAHAERLQKRTTELERLQAAGYEEKLLGRIDEATWRSHHERWQTEIDELRTARNTTSPLISRDEFLRRVRTPLELVQRAARQYVAQSEHEKASFLRIVCSNYTVCDGSITVSMRSPYDAYRKAAESGDWLGDRESNPD